MSAAQAIQPLVVNSRVREHCPEIATIVDAFNQLLSLYEAQASLTKNITEQRDLLKSEVVDLRAENITLRAMLKAKDGTA